MKVAIVYDRVNKWGGAERVLLALHKLFPEAPLYTSVYNPATAVWAKVFKIQTTFLQKLPFIRAKHELFPFLMPVAFESLRFDTYDLVISVTSEYAKGILTSQSTRHVCICLTPTRYLWSGYKDYINSKILKIVTRPLISYLRRWDLMASRRPDHFIAISKTVQKRIKNYYERTSTIIYPPLMLDTKKAVKKRTKKIKSDYFLVVARISRFTPYKRVDIVMEAAKMLGVKLKIVGENAGILAKEGSLPQNVEFLGKLTDSELALYYQNCRALIFPGKEDFGLAMVEAQAFGKPVIAFKAGGALEIIKEGQTGAFFSTQSASSLAQVLKNFDEKRYNSKKCIENARRFSYEVFEKNLREFLTRTYNLKI